MSTSGKRPHPTTEAVIAGKKVKVATPSEVKVVTERLKKQYTRALDNLKDR